MGAASSMVNLNLLIFACLLDFGFVQLFKYAQRRRHNAAVVVCTNYLTLAVVLCAYFGLTGQLSLSIDAVKVGVITGCAFILSMSVMTRSLQHANVAAVLMAFRMSIIVPVVASVFLWSEAIGVVQLVGVVLALPALAMVTYGTSESQRVGGPRALVLVMFVFCAQGMSHCCMRWVHYAGLDSQTPQVLMVVGATAGSLGALLVALRGHRPRRAEILTGGGIGLYNLLALLVILAMLSRMDGTVVFPTLGCTLVVLDSLSAHFIWKEPLRRLAWAGLAMAVLAVLLVLA
jgi:drug/metabolite transporter (DMT)-like permease